jgi:hypothetical protein
MHRSICAAVAAVAASLAVPALASADTYCVNVSPCSGSSQRGVQAALDAAKFHLGDDVVKVGASAQPYAGGFIYFEGAANDNDVSIVGAGRGQTVFTSTSALPPLSLGQNSSVSHLTLRVSPNQAGATGLGLFGGIADDVEVIGQGVSADARGITTSDVSQIRTSAVRMSNGIGVLAENKDQDTDLDDSQVSARVGVLAKEGADLDVYRTKLYGTELGAGAEGEGSELWLSNVLLTTSGPNATGARVIGGAEGGLVYTTVSRSSQTPSDHPGVLETAALVGASSELEVKSSTIDGYAPSIRRFAAATASAKLSVVRSNYDADTAELAEDADVSLFGNIDAQPLFVNQFPINFLITPNFALRADSALIDAATICAPTTQTDLAGNARCLDSNGDGQYLSDMGAYEYQRITPTADFTAGPAVAGGPVAFDAGPSQDGDPGDESLFTYAWSFGDGQTGSGREPSHVYSQPGDYSVALTVTDPMGLTASATRVVSVAAAPAGGSGTGGGATDGGGTGAGDSSAPVVSRLTVSPRRIPIGTAPARLSSRGGQIRFRLSEPARVTLRFTSARTGKLGGRVRLSGRAGVNSVRFAGRVSRRKTLRPGVYRLSVRAADAAGNRSAAKGTRFTLLPRR